MNKQKKKKKKKKKDTTKSMVEFQEIVALPILRLSNSFLIENFNAKTAVNRMVP